MKINLLIPLAGSSTYETSDSHTFPKLLTDVNGKLVVERAIQPFLDMEHELNVVVVVSQAANKEYKLANVVNLIAPKAKVLEVKGETQGSVCSSLFAIEAIEKDSPLIITSFEQIIDEKLDRYIDEFIEQDADAGVLTFEGVHPKWSFVIQDEDGIVSQAAEKRPISKQAIAGFYFYKNAEDFIRSAKNVIRNDVTTDGKFFVSETLNQIILVGGKVTALPLDRNSYHHFSDEHSLSLYEETVQETECNIEGRINNKTLEYVDGFNRKDINSISQMFNESFRLSDPSVTITGKIEVLNYISDIFEQFEKLSFIAKRVLIQGYSSVIEFELSLNEKVLIGVDVITWDSKLKMKTMNAYLYEKQDES